MAANNKYREYPFAYLISCLMIFLTACFENPHPAKLTTEIMGATSEGVRIRSVITFDGGSDILQAGICYSTNRNPTIADFLSYNMEAGSSYETTLSAISETTWYIRSYAVNAAGAGYGNEVSFSFAKVEVLYFGEITGVSASFQVNIVAENQIQSKGVCWSTSPEPTIADNLTNEGTGTGVFTSMITGLAPGTTYYARAYASKEGVTFYSGDIVFTTKDYPTLSTREIIDPGTFILASGGDIIFTGNAMIQKAGVCWSTHPHPEISDSTSEANLYNLGFYSQLKGLEPGQTYYIRSYATNIVGTGYGNEIVTTMPQAAAFDIDGNPYSSVTIGMQTWTVENLRTTRYANGDPVTESKDLTGWRNLTTEAWGYYENDPQYDYPYGKLYNWYAASDSRNVCPTGWHVPSDSEWSTLIDFLGGSAVAGGKLKEAGLIHWMSAESGITNSTGFTALPGACRPADFFTYIIGSSAFFWGRTSYDESDAYYRYLGYGTAINSDHHPKQFGYSVRCIKDN